MSSVSIVEVGLRDGLQNESQILSLPHRYQLIEKLSSSGLKRIEVGSFVSPKAIPQMNCVSDLAKKVLYQQKKGKLPKNISYSAFVPNLKGLEKAAECGIKEVSVFVSCTESFSKKNINMNIKESLKSLKSICQWAHTLKIKVRAYLSVVVACPYEGKIHPSRVATLAERIMEQGVFELSLSDTIGVACYLDVSRLLHSIQKKIPARQIALHFHDTRGTGLANVIAGLQNGVRVFDSSIGGLGGCPYAPGASGNIATEDLAYMLKQMKFKTHVRIENLISCTKFIEKRLKRTLPSKLSVSGLPNLIKKGL